MPPAGGPAADPAGERTIQAVRNNAGLCDAVSRAHGLVGAFYESCWVQAHRPLPLYPNVVTLTSDHVDSQLASVERLMADQPGRPWSVKDSFSVLPLERVGMGKLFDAQWVHCPAPLTTTTETEPGAHRWARVGDPLHLAAWEEVWGSRSGWSGRSRVFPDRILSDPDLAPVAIVKDATVVAGLLANRAAGAVGVSNVFARPADRRAIPVGLAAAASLWPGLPLVGYGSGPDLGVLMGLGFESVGPLRIWQANIATGGPADNE